MRNACVIPSLFVSQQYFTTPAVPESCGLLRFVSARLTAPSPARQVIMDVRLDYRISCLLSIYKREWDSVFVGDRPVRGPRVDERIAVQAEDIFGGG